MVYKKNLPPFLCPDATRSGGCGGWMGGWATSLSLCWVSIYCRKLCAGVP